MGSPFRPLFKAAQRLWDHIVLAYDTRLAPAGEILLEKFVPEGAEQPRWRRRPVKPDLERLEVRWVPYSYISWGPSNGTAYDYLSSVTMEVDISPYAYPSPVTVDYYTLDGSAKAGVDYVPQRGTLTFPVSPNGTANYITVTLLNDGGVDGTESFKLRLVNPSSNAAISGSADYTVNMYENGGSPTYAVSLSASSPDPYQSQQIGWGKEVEFPGDGGYNTIVDALGNVVLRPGPSSPLELTLPGLNPNPRLPGINDGWTPERAWPTRGPLITAGWGSEVVYPGSGDVQVFQALPSDPQASGNLTRLIYNSATDSPAPIITTDVKTDASKGLPTDVKARLTFGGTVGSWTTFGTTGHAAGDDYYLGVQPGNALTSSGLYTYQLDVVADYASGPVTFSYSGSTPVINRDGAAFGNGWGLATLESIIPVSGGVLMAFGNGGARFFQTGTVGATTSYVSPPADSSATLVKNADGTYTYTGRNRIQRLFDTAGRQTGIVNPDGVTNTYTYDGFGRPMAILNPDGTVLTFTYDAGGWLQTAAASGGRTVTFSHDTYGNLTAAATPDGGLRTLAYDAAHRLVTDAMGTSLETVTYDSASHKATLLDRGRGATVSIDAAQVRGLYTPVARGLSDNVGVVTNAAGSRATYTLDALGRLLGLATADGARQTWTRDSWGDITGNTDALQRQTTWTYDGGGNLWSQTRPDGSTTSFTFDQTLHEPTGIVDALGDQATFTYSGTGDLLTHTDQLNRTTTFSWTGGYLQSATDPLGQRTTYLYDAFNRLLAAVDALGNRTTSGYDAAGDPQTVTDPLNRTTSLSYDGFGRVVAWQTPDGYQTTYSYDPRGWMTGTTNPRGDSFVYTLDSRGNPVSVLEGAGSPTQRTTTFVYDLLDRLTARTDPLNRTTSFGYDLLGRLVTVTNPLLGVATTNYDAAGEVTSFIDPLGRTTSYSYDAAGRRVTATNPLLYVTTSVYDALGHLVATVDPLGRRSTTVYDAASQAVAVVDTLGYRTTAAYNADGWLVSSTDPLLQTTSYSYDAAGRRTGVVDALGNRATWVYDAAGQLIAAIDASRRTTSYSYDLGGRLISLLDGLGNRATTSYDAGGNVVATTDPLNHTTTFVYDLLDRRTGATDPLGQRTTWVYDVADQLLATTDPLNHTTSFVYDAAGRRTAAVDALNQRTTVVYDLAGQAIALLDALGGRTTSSYDLGGRLVALTDAVGHTSTAVYDAVGNVLAVVDPLLARTSYSYDLLDRRLTRTNALGGVETIGYDAAGREVSVTHENGSVTSYAYDLVNRPVAVTDPLGFTQTSVYDPVGRLLALIDQAGHATSYSYDAAGRRVAVTDPLGQTSTSVYDAASRLVSVADPLLHTVTYLYDALDRQIAQVDPLGRATSVIYDAAGNRQAVVDPAGNRTSFVYDALNRPVTQTDALNHVTTTAYDALDRVTAATDPLGQTRRFGYDLVGHELTEQWVSPTQQVVQTATFTYDAGGNQLTAQNPSGTYTLAYDLLHRVSVAQEPFGQTLTFGYDALGNRTLVQDSQSGVATSVYDTRNELTSRQFNGPGQTPLRFDYSYTPTGQVNREVRFSNLAGTATVGYTQFAYDVKNRLTNLQHQNASGSALANYTYSYDAADRLSSKVENGTTFTYAYDNTDQLTSDNGTSYSYDTNGNRNLAGYQTGPANQTTSDGTWTYTYDADGQMAKKSKGAAAQTWTYGYDYAGHMTWAEQRATDGGTLQQRVEYNYDAWGNRLSVVVKDGNLNVLSTQRFAYDGWKTNLDAGGQQAGSVGQENFDVWADLNGSNALVTRRVYGNGVDELQARESAVGAVGWYLTDSPGSVRLITDGSGVANDTLSYDAWGHVTSESAPAAGDRYKFTGRELDAVTGLQYSRGRYYSADLGKWTSTDPQGFGAGDANLYRYVGNGPTNFTDPTGEEKRTVLFKTYEQMKEAGVSRTEIDWNKKIGAQYANTQGDIYKKLGLTGAVGDYSMETTDFVYTGTNKPVIGPNGQPIRVWVIKNEKTGKVERIGWELNQITSEGKVFDYGFLFFDTPQQLLDEYQAYIKLLLTVQFQVLPELAGLGVTLSVPQVGPPPPRMRGAPVKAPAAYKFEARGISYSSEVVKNADGSTSIVHYATKDGTRHTIGISEITKEGQLTNAFEVPKELQQLDLSKRMYAEAESVGFKSTAGQYHPSSDNFKEFYKVYDPAKANEVEALFQTPAGKVAKQSGMKPTQIKVGPDKVEVVWVKE